MKINVYLKMKKNPFKISDFRNSALLNEDWVYWKCIYWSFYSNSDDTLQAKKQKK